MPCYEVRTISIEFHVSNLDLLKKALEKMNVQVVRQDENGITFNKGYDQFTISFLNSKISSPSYNEKKLTDFSNQIKRSYSEYVINEVAKKQKWLFKKINATKFQLQRF